MKIVFLCGGVGQGQDGVGDYTRKLSSEIIKDGHQAAIIAINDKFIAGYVEEDQLNSNFKIIRIPSKWESKVRYDTVRNLIREINPDWISLQYVPFSFQDKGLNWGLSNSLRKLGTDHKWHIMFHELWIGMDKEAKKKHKIWGMLQKLMIVTLITKLKPSVVHTQSKLYQLQLNRIGFKSDILPLFGNIPVIKDDRDNGKKGISFVIFGTIHSEGPVKDFVEEALKYSQKHQVNFSLKTIGRSGPEQSNWKNIWEAAGFKVTLFGEREPEYISKTLSSSSIGISTSAYTMIDKSGTVASMLDHGLPVICVSRPWNANKIDKIIHDPNIIEYLPGNFEYCITRSISTKSYARTYNTADLLLKSLV